MAHMHHELNLDANGNLLDLRNKSTKALLSPGQVAECVRVYHLKGIEVDGEPKAISEAYSGKIQGKNVNVIGGATGTGKTSLIYILAGGMQTEAKLQSDTKCPTIYILDQDGSEVAILDTAGLCDTDAEANKAPEVQDLLVNAVAATIKRFKLKVVSFLMCVDVGGRLPGKFCEVWPQMQVSLGGEKLGSLCHFVMNKVNADSKVAVAQQKKLQDSEAYKQLKYSSLRWPVATSGYENLDAIKAILKPASQALAGLGTEDVRSDVEGLEVKRKKADKVQKDMLDLKRRLQEEKVKGDQIMSMLDYLRDSIDRALLELASLGICDWWRRGPLKTTVRAFKLREANLKEQWRTGQLNEQEQKTACDTFLDDFNQKMEEIREMEKLGDPFRDMAKVVVKIVKSKL